MAAEGMIRVATGDGTMGQDGQKLFITDAIGPFFRGTRHRRVNWSKIPFADFQPEGKLDEARLSNVAREFEVFCAHAVAAGFNAISLDDVAHLADSADYPDSLRDLVAGCRRCFNRFLKIASRYGLKVFLTCDVMFFPAGCDDALQKKIALPDFLAGCLRELFSTFDGIAGIIIRIGESDGLDVRDVFRSRLTIRTPAQCRRWIAALLEVCEKFQRDLVVRTWSVGAYRIGDLIWNRDTFSRVFDSFDSDRLIISMKYGETDFFRFLPLNPRLFSGRHRKIVELQARREYEGCGEFPSFIGWDYQRYRDELLAGGANLAGIMVWCQTGGWTTFRRLTWLKGSSVWNEINAHVTVRLFRDGMSTEDAIADWCASNGRGEIAYDLLHLLRLSDEVIRELLYIDDFAEQKLFFRRLRVPPLLWIFWDQIVITHAMSRTLDCFVRDGRRQIRRAEIALQKIDRMRELARRCGLPEEDVVFERDTFEILAAAREYFFLPPSPEREQRLHSLARDYLQRHPDRHYSVRLDFHPAPLKRRTLERIFRVLIRRQRGYRWLDRIVTLRLLSWLYPLLRRRVNLLPDFASERAMGIDAVFK